MENKYLVCISLGRNVLRSLQDEFVKILTSHNKYLNKGDYYICRLKDVCKTKEGTMAIVVPIEKIEFNNFEDIFKFCNKYPNDIYREKGWEQRTINYSCGFIEVRLPTLNKYKYRKISYESTLYDYDNYFEFSSSVGYYPKKGFKYTKNNYILNQIEEEKSCCLRYLDNTKESNKKDIEEIKVEKIITFKTEEEAKNSGFKYKKVIPGYYKLPNPHYTTYHIFSEYKTVTRSCTKEEEKAYLNSYIECPEKAYWETVKPEWTGEILIYKSNRYRVKKHIEILDKLLESEKNIINSYTKKDDEEWNI